MYEIIKAVIESGRFELADMIKKIETIWIQGNLTDEQKTELIELARENAIPENSYAGIQNQLDSIFENLADIVEEILAMREDIAQLQGGTTLPLPEPDEWPEYVAPTGAHDAYKVGDKITFKGAHYICKMDGCVWDPETYPAGWEKTE